MVDLVSTAVTACVLAGGEGRRMNGQDKGLVNYEGRPLAAWVLQMLAAQTGSLCISANRNVLPYQSLLIQAAHGAGHADMSEAASSLVWPDDPDLPPSSGPLAGILTALRRTPTDWLLVVPCDMPHLPADLLAQLQQQALRTHADIVVPMTQLAGEAARHHWVCALVHKRVCAPTQALFDAGERKVGNWVRSLNWSSVSFNDVTAFANMNKLETLHGHH